MVVTTLLLASDSDSADVGLALSPSGFRLQGRF